uniref:Store-operated calcium entry-associated regulatory factor n=1 Tax=Ditylenchus dipsaci TaxID=166011 RepID=A0A915CVW8_9BILA
MSRQDDFVHSLTINDSKTSVELLSIYEEFDCFPSYSPNWLIILPSCDDAQSDRVLLRDVTSITLRRGSYTTGKRSSPVPQLKCVGGTAYGEYSPKAVQCINRGFDGVDVQWKQSRHAKRLEFGKIDVSCEDYTSSGAKKGAYNKKPNAPGEEDNKINYANILYFLIACFVVYLIYTSLYTPRQGNEGDRRGGGGSFDSGPPPPPGWRQPPPPPSYDESCKQGTGSQSNAEMLVHTPTTQAVDLDFSRVWDWELNVLKYSGYGNTFRRRNHVYNQFEQDTGFDGRLLALVIVVTIVVDPAAFLEVVVLLALTLRLALWNKQTLRARNHFQGVVLFCSYVHFHLLGASLLHACFVTMFCSDKVFCFKDISLFFFGAGFQSYPRTPSYLRRLALPT